jgi:Fic family protein
VAAVIDGKRVLGPPKDIREMQNVYEQMSTLNPESMEDLLLAHRMMMQDLVPDAGCFRSGNVGVFRGDQLIHAGTPAAYVPEVMRQLFAWLPIENMIHEHQEEYSCLRMGRA